MSYVQTTTLSLINYFLIDKGLFQIYQALNYKEIVYNLFCFYNYLLILLYFNINSKHHKRSVYNSYYITNIYRPQKLHITQRGVTKCKQT